MGTSLGGRHLHQTIAVVHRTTSFLGVTNVAGPTPPGPRDRPKSLRPPRSPHSEDEIEISFQVVAADGRYLYLASARRPVSNP